MNKTIQEHYVRRAGGLYKGTRADQPAAGGAQRWDRQPVGPVVFLHTPSCTSHADQLGSTDSHYPFSMA